MAEQEQVVRTAAFTIDLAAKKVHRSGTEVRLTPTEWAILEILIRQRGALVPHRRLLAEVWGPQYRAQTNYLRVYRAAAAEAGTGTVSSPLPHHRTRHGLPLRIAPGPHADAGPCAEARAVIIDPAPSGQARPFRAL